jgi:molybdenum cofactor cytidylyltransferase
MGRPKALLRHQDGQTTFVAHAIRESRTAGLSPVLVVGRDEDHDLRHAVSIEEAGFVVNPQPDRGQLSSLLAALDVVSHDPAVSAVMVLPVDVPMVSESVLRQVLRRAADDRCAIARAVHLGRHGHPVLFKREVFNDLRSADPDIGARAVVNADPRRVIDVEVGESSLVADVDTPEDYAQLFGRRPG